MRSSRGRCATPMDRVEEQALGVIGRIYDASVHPALWREVVGAGAALLQHRQHPASRRAAALRPSVRAAAADKRLLTRASPVAAIVFATDPDRATAFDVGTLKAMFG